MDNLKLLLPTPPGAASILTPEALQFTGEIASRFGSAREEILRRRKEVQAALNDGSLPNFLPATEEVRRSAWRVAPFPKELEDRRVEITGPAGNRKMVINGLNSGARVYMADGEDSEAPAWENVLQGQINLRDAVRQTIEFKSEGKEYRLKDKPAVLFYRPRGWHLSERAVESRGKPVSASLVDFSLFFFHNAKALVERGSGPYFYLPKLESHLEARLWNDVFIAAQEILGLPRGTVKATVLVETILAAFEMDEILYELREHSAGLNCGRWDYIFSYIKKFSRRPGFLLPDRAQVTMDKGFLKAYVDLVIRTCHRRGAHAMGGMAAQIPIKDNPKANEEAMAKVSADKKREVLAGHDGTWVAHPGLVPLALEIFNTHMPQPNQISKLLDDVTVSAEDLLRPVQGTITEKGLRTNISVGLRYLESWLRGNGCVPINHLMEDAATAEISRAQLWQWVFHGAVLDDGRKVTLALVRSMLKEERGKIEGGGAALELAGKLFDEMASAEIFPEFLTLAAYPHLK